MADSLPLLEEIAASYQQGRRIVLKARGGEEVEAVKAALPGVEIVVFDLSRVTNESELAVAAGVALKSKPDLRTALLNLDTQAKSRPIALFISNIDGCAGLPDEAGVVGRLRGEVQGLHNVWVSYSAKDDGFLARHLASPLGSFFKQAVIVDL